MKKYEVTGMSCAACQARVEKAVSSVDGVESCAVSLLTNSMGVEGSASDEDIIKAVENAGYGAAVMGADSNGGSKTEDIENALVDRETPLLKKRLIVSVIFLLMLMYISMGHMMWGWPLPELLHNNVILAEMILAIIIMVINKKFFISGFKSLFHGSPNMDTLVALGSTASFGYSLLEIYLMRFISSSSGYMMAMQNLYFESAAMIPTLITVGKLLESISKGRTTDALKSLLKLSPKEATVLRDDKEIRVPVEEVNVGDIYILKAGDLIPVDGEIIEGSSAVDESALTGESIPVDKVVGDLVSSGTMNQNGFLKCKATRVGEDTTISQIIQMMSDAAATKAPLARVADKVSAIFVPSVIILAVITFVAWILIGRIPSIAFEHAIAVLVISCPCALGLATPVAIMVGNGMGAKNGCLYKTAEALESAGRTGIVVLDKTGTITKGEPGVTDIVPEDGISSEELLTVAYSLEKMSEHPLAKAIVKYAEQSKQVEIKLDDFETLPGAGVRAVVSSTYMGDGFTIESGTIVEAKRGMAEDLAREGKTPLLFVAGDKNLGIIAVADQIKEDSEEGIQELKRMGIHTIMLTGDNKLTAEAIARKASVDDVIAEVMPDQKQMVISSLQEIMLTKKYKIKVAMVGDGINDAIALTKADTGFAIGAGTDVAVDAADVVLMKNSIRDVAAAIRLSRKTITNIHQNLFWAFFYNALCIPLAMGLYGITLKPMYGAAAMALSSFFVCMNALRLNLVRPYDSSKDKPLRHLSSEELRSNIDKEINNIKEEIEEDKKEALAEKEGGIMKKTITIEGMMCEHCEATVQKALESIEGVKSAKASHKKGTAVVKLEQDVDNEVLTKAVTDKDYKVVDIK